MGAAIRGPSGLIELGAEPLTIGRSRTNRLVLTNSQISSRHAEIQPLAGGRYQVVDVGSTNGTAVNGVKLGAGVPQPLNAGDTILLGGSGGVELHFELTADAAWQAGQPQAASPAGAPFGAPGGFGLSDPSAPPAQPAGGAIGQPPPGAAGFPPAPGGFGPPAGQPGPGQAFPAPQEAFPAPPGGFAPPNQLGVPGSQPAAGPAFPPPGSPGPTGFDASAGAAPVFPPPAGAGAAPFGAPGGQGAGFPPAGGPQFGPPGAGPAFVPPGGQAPFGAPGGQAAPGFPSPGAAPVKKRAGRNIFLLVGSIIVLALIVVGIVFGVRAVTSKNSPSPTPTPKPTTPASSTPTGHVWEPPAALASPLLAAERASAWSVQY